jgi:hypothetical protein
VFHARKARNQRTLARLAQSQRSAQFVSGLFR